MTRKRFDRTRALAALIILLAVIFFYLNVFAPKRLPKLLRFGMLRQPVTILILGTDITFDAVTRKPIKQLEGRADTIILARVDPLKSKINLLSIPRDTLAEIPGLGKRKINSAHAFGGIELTRQTITDLTGKKIDYFIAFNPGSVIGAIDSLGGVRLEVEKDMRYVDRAQGLDINLKMGWQNLSGQAAQDYLRFRHDAEGDIGRLSRQQKFFKAFVKTLAQPGSIIKAPLALKNALGEIKTNLSPAQTARLLNLARTLPLDQINPVTLSGETAIVDGASVWQPDWPGVAGQLKEFSN